MGGEHAAASVVAVARAGKLFGLHLNDGHGRAGEEDGLPFGSVHAGEYKYNIYIYIYCRCKLYIYIFIIYIIYYLHYIYNVNYIYIYN